MWWRRPHCREGCGDDVVMFLRRDSVAPSECADCGIWTLSEKRCAPPGDRAEVVADLGEETDSTVARARAGKRWPICSKAAMPRRGGKAGSVRGSRHARRQQWAHVDLRGMRVERVREFGQVYLALSLWRRLGLHGLAGLCRAAWRRFLGRTATFLTVARFCGQLSELDVAERWFRTALEELLGVLLAAINDDRLYRGLDVLAAHKDTLCAPSHGPLPRLVRRSLRVPSLRCHQHVLRRAGRRQ